MADLDDIKDGKDFRTDQPQQNIPFILKGCGALDWGMQSRLSRIFNPKTGNTVMLAFDHGYFQGPTTGLERIDINIAPLFEHADVLMCTRGILRSVVPPATNKPVVLRASGANSILAELSNEAVALSMDDAVRLNSCAVAAQVYIGSEYEHQSIKNIIQLVAKYESKISRSERDASDKHKIPCLIPIGNKGDGIPYCSNDVVDIETVLPDAYLAIEITTNLFTPVFCKNDRVLFANRFPENGEIAVFMKSDKAYLRKFIEEEDGYCLKSLNGRGFDILLRRMDEVDCIGTCIGIVRA